MALNVGDRLGHYDIATKIGEGGTGGQFEVIKCLRLARLSGESADSVLRAADKHDVADLLAQLYGRWHPSVDRSDQRRLDLWRALPEKDRATIEGLMESLAEKAANRTKRSA